MRSEDVRGVLIYECYVVWISTGPFVFSDFEVNTW